MKYLTPVSLDKSTIENTIKQIVTNVKEGHISGLEAYVAAKGLERISKEVLKQIKTEAIDEGELYPKLDRTYMGAEFSISNGTVTPNLEEDEIFADLKARMKKREELLREAFKNRNKGSRIVDEDTGEVVPIVNAKSVSGSNITIRFK